MEVEKKINNYGGLWGREIGGKMAKKKVNNNRHLWG